MAQRLAQGVNKKVVDFIFYSHLHTFSTLKSNLRHKMLSLYRNPSCLPSTMSWKEAYDDLQEIFWVAYGKSAVAFILPNNFI